MNAKLKKPIQFVVTVVVGSLLVLFDIPLILLLPLILIVGFALLLAMGSLTIAEIRGALRFEDLRKIGIFRRLDEMKFFEKNVAGTKKAPIPVPEKKEVKKEGEATPGIFAHISAFFSSIGSLGSILRQRSRQGKKVDDINKLLDKTVNEKVSAPPPAALKPATVAGSAPGGAGGGMPSTPAGEDPFVSLSGDEFDEGLLDGLGDDMAMTPQAAPAGKIPDAGSGPATTATGPDLTPPTLDISAAAGDILKNAGEGGGLEEFSGLDGSDVTDADFGDLDNLNLDEVSLEADLGESPDKAAAAPAPSPEAPAQPAPAAAPAVDSNGIKTAWIPSDAPKDATEINDEVSTQADMAAFASGSDGDVDLISSIASDVKQSKKEQDISLLRELKDFRAPASEIQTELDGMYERMSMAQKTKKKNPPATDGMK